MVLHNCPTVGLLILQLILQDTEGQFQLIFPAWGSSSYVETARFRAFRCTASFPQTVQRKRSLRPERSSLTAQAVTAYC